ncbi:ribosome-associated toxin RatA of RatAB toxin-antitoxin module [Crossiella equi]|uniref:Ribosome-associated toxin RatA of RatAB toxin-antitoxin module n=1 Tax=Crossiella equi TaxID=130796 RepID=A0ABS5ANA0_9PSEU|nr:SRPBCC family protein [Crossiella equi]MBP2477867.1 ribosome-associated toxin RatA of RatAB toxin-antitoxin module [Crossiella equi]
MRRVRLLATVPGISPGTLFQLLTDFGRFPGVAPEIRSVLVHPPEHPGGPRHSDWEVNFRRGVLRWREWEHLDPVTASVEFGQTEGDFEHFRGTWRVTPDGSDCVVRFQVEFDFGIASLAEAMEPVADRLLRTAMGSVLSGLFGPDTQLHDYPLVERKTL